MSISNTKDEKIEKLKYELIHKYIILMISILAVYFTIFTFFSNDQIMSWYLAGGMFFLIIMYFIIRLKYHTYLIFKIHMILAPLYNYYFILVFWNVSVANFCWLLPVPLGAYVLFSKKEVIVYSGYILLLIIAGYFIADNISSNFPTYSQRQVMFTDTILFISNILIIVLLIYYKDKIRKQEMLSRIEDQKTQENNPNNLEPTSYDLDTELMERLFERIEMVMTKNELFRDIKINLSKLSVVLEVNSSYISKAIRYKGYPNFSTYLNIYRVNHVKKLLHDSDFQKITLMYIYTEAGFSNQSTFNRVFKQIEGITPSEYLQKNIKNTIHR